MISAPLRELYRDLTAPAVIPGKATRNGTAHYFSGFLSHENFVNPVYFCTEVTESRWIVSRAGTGTYRFSPSSADHKAALTEALLSGINVIDTAPGFSDGGAEYLAGTVLRELINLGRIQRSGIVVITKGGMIEGRYLRYLKETKTEKVHYVNPALAYSLEPEILKEQLTLSLARLGIQTADVFLLSNPVYLLKAAGEDFFYKKIREAFLFLESLRIAGFIQYYGITLNNDSSWPPDPGILPDESLPGFQVIQGPANFAEQSFLKTRIRMKHIWKIAHRPFNSLVRCDPPLFIRFAAMQPYLQSSELSLKISELKNSLRTLEYRIVSLHPENEFRFEPDFPSLLSLAENYDQTGINPESCLFLTEKIRRTMEKTIRRIQLAGILKATDPLLRHWLHTMNQLIFHLELRVRSRAYEYLLDLETDLNRIAAAKHRISLGGLVLLWLTGLKNEDSHAAGTVLCGARNLIYLRDILISLQREPLDEKKLNAISEKAGEFLLQYQTDFCKEKI